MKNNALILSTEATLKTLQVTIQAITVNGKQMTLAVFRQLPEIYVLDENINITGTPWGLVRYSIKDSGSLWVVLEKDGILYRGEFPTPISTSYEERNLTQAKEERAKLISNERPSRFRKPSRNKPIYKGYTYVGEGQYSEDEYRDIMKNKILSYRSKWEGYMTKMSKMDKEIEKLEHYLRVRQQLNVAISYQIERLSKLQQLFIAV